MRRSMSEVFQDVGADAGAFLDEAEQDVLGPDVFVIESLGLLVGECHDLAGAISKSFKHCSSPGGFVSPAWTSRPDAPSGTSLWTIRTKNGQGSYHYSAPRRVRMTIIGL